MRNGLHSKSTVVSAAELLEDSTHNIWLLGFRPLETRATKVTAHTNGRDRLPQTLVAHNLRNPLTFPVFDPAFLQARDRLPIQCCVSDHSRVPACFYTLQTGHWIVAKAIGPPR